jgi:hypothetical protein
MARKTTIYAETESAKEKVASGKYKRKCAKGCACTAAGKETPSDKPKTDNPPNK